MIQKIIFQGAEAVILKQGNQIIKDRIKKNYRLTILDEKIRKQRTKAETKLLHKASKIINTPVPEDCKEKNKIKMPFIDGKKLSEHLNNFSLKKQKQICREIGKSIAKLHENHIIHGDLTTSNMILVENQKKLDTHPSSSINKNSINKKFKRSALTKFDSEQLINEQTNPIIYFIDFGLGFISQKYEDKAVDLHLLKQALEAKHFQNWEVLIKEVFKEYQNYKDSKIIFERLKAVEKRGRYKH